MTDHSYHTTKGLRDEPPSTLAASPPSSGGHDDAADRAIAGVADDGNPRHPGDMAAQLELALDNVEAVLTGADMTPANVVRLNAYTTDIDELFTLFPRITDRFGAENRFATSVLGVARLPAQLLVMLEATALD
jgi:enamine deaminase RidA (YjgF/YER057c/UK114 family)